METLSRHTILAVVAALLCGCYGPPRGAPPTPTPYDRAEALLFRMHETNATLIPVAIGIGEQTFLTLKVGEYGVLPLPEGQHRLFVQAMTTPLHGLPPARGSIDVALVRDRRTCIRAVPDPQNLWRAAVPWLMTMVGPRFELQVVSCPGNAELERLKRVAASGVRTQ